MHHLLKPSDSRRLFAALSRWFGEKPEIDSVQSGFYRFWRSIYRSLGESELGKPQPVIIYFHGGGWVLGDRAHDILVDGWLSVKLHGDRDRLCIIS